MAEPTTLNVSLALVPRAVIAAMHTTMISASMTAYSTAVGPSSRFRNSTTFLVIDNMRLYSGNRVKNRTGGSNTERAGRRVDRRVRSRGDGRVQGDVAEDGVGVGAEGGDGGDADH